MKEAIVLAGGFGTRLKAVIADIPKPMALINDKPFLVYQLNYLKKFGIERVIFSVGYRYEYIQNYFGNNFNGIEIVYAIEESPLGTGGGIKLALKHAFFPEVLVVNGDTLFDVDILRFEKMYRASGAKFCLALRKVEDVSRYGSVEIDADFQIISFLEKGQKSGAGLINGGTYIIENSFFETIVSNEVFSLEKDCLEIEVKNQKIIGIPFDSYFLDIGIPEDFKKAQDEFKYIGY